MSRTEQYLEEAFAGESRASCKYLAFARAAEREGYPQAARLFRAAAEAETIHARNHLKALGAIRGTRENLAAAVAGERYEVEEMYPGMVEAARAEGHKEAERSFRWALATEEIHARLYQELLDGLDPDGGEAVPYFVCPGCGHTVSGAPPAVCPLCGAKGEKYLRVD